jgi:hypothetical protein
MKKEGLRRKTTLEKKKVSSGFARVAWVMGRPAESTGFLHWPIFCLTRTCPATRSRVNQLGQSEFNNYGDNDIYPKTYYS